MSLLCHYMLIHTNGLTHLPTWQGGKSEGLLLDQDLSFGSTTC